MGAPTAYVPDSFDGQMSYTISNYLRKLKKQVGITHTHIMYMYMHTHYYMTHIHVQCTCIK